jgi:GMP synthase (glutamine-hydrolysing)
MKRSLLILTHAAWETPALIDVALERAFSPNELEVHRMAVVDQSNPVLPAVDDLAGLVVMGGPQDANDDVRHPGLAAERRILAEATAKDVPVLGVCLGMQLLALALGAKLHLRHGKEIGLAEVNYTEAARLDPILGPVARCVVGPSDQPRPAPVLHWHYDAVELPRGATLLASTAKTPVQAFRLGSALGTQFHAEAEPTLLGRWLDEPRMIGGFSAQEIDDLRHEGVRHLPRLREPALLGFSAFAASVRARL